MRIVLYNIGAIDESDMEERIKETSKETSSSGLKKKERDTTFE